MRHLVIDNLRSKKRKAQVDGISEDLEDSLSVAGPGISAHAILAIDEALDRLEQRYPRRAQITMLRFYGGFNMEEIAEILGVSSPTIKREWRLARLWFAHQLKELAP